ncbi:hypothetical protein MARCHEWKA_02000 [Brevundimonas phage vB_BpoS-Marchewka]|uniref:Uncharacterized protein n=1 Tax=Brevundimonas phage vB_BpoS-Marchewka TaxID=2948604 RepID=A0A9E7SQU9_9CAUD|nr:hypothetical protein MARCHEWKA_02000 [Brevundimonas phage vB_BpoS-Marchewka]UTC29158.1 hypothetical protein BAMBUS_00750 [Brevundimonas phage vB_BpoS-Bambus]
MKTNPVGDAMIALMRREGGGVIWSVCVMDGWMNSAFCDAVPEPKLWKGMSPHPLNRAQVAASWLGRDERFEIGRLHACDSLGRNRVLRLYSLKEEFRASDED